jgi:hypothetical protein
MELQGQVNCTHRLEDLMKVDNLIEMTAGYVENNFGHSWLQDASEGA